jgi:hypothetical protein
MAFPDFSTANIFHPFSHFVQQQEHFRISQLLSNMDTMFWPKKKGEEQNGRAYSQQRDYYLNR